MDNVSVSKGLFASKSYKIGVKKRKTPRDFAVDNELWYQGYTKAWSIIKNAAEEINENMFKQIVADLHSYIADVKDHPAYISSREIPTAILLTGVNLPDHGLLFRKLTSKLSSITERIALLESRDSTNMKNLLETTVFQLINNSQRERQVKKNECTLRLLKSWHAENCPDMPLVIVIREFESFNSNILRDFILVLSSYNQTMKFVLIFGVATTLHAVHRSLSYDVTSKLRVQVFHTDSQIKSLSTVVEGTVLSGRTPFMLTGRTFQLLTDIFLFYDFSVHCFLQGYKLCMIQHFYENNLNALCCDNRQTKQNMSDLNSQDITELRKLPSIINYLEKNRKKYPMELSDGEFKNLVLQLIDEFHDTMNGFFLVLRCLHYLTCSLPGAPLGQELREVYANAVTRDLIVSQDYKDSLKLLNLLSKEVFLEKLEKILDILKNTNNNRLEDVEMNLWKHKKLISEASLEIATDTADVVSLDQKMSRLQLKQKLLTASQKQSRSPYKQLQIDLIQYLDSEVFSVFLVNPNRLPASEVCCFSDFNIGKHHLRGSLRAAIHTGLTDPQMYLQCNCCKLESDERILTTLPDLSIIYKLHKESGKLINMYDWLQAFLTIVNPNDEVDEQRELDPEMQARFTQSVAELQFLGFIKTSRRKTDHVKRLT